MKKRVLSIVLAAVLLLGLMPGLAIPARATDTEVATWADLQTAISSVSDGGTATIKLTQNLTATETTDKTLEIMNGKKITLDLNGFVLDRNLIDADGSKKRND